MDNTGEKGTRKGYIRYSDEVATEILDRMCAGELLTDILKSNPVKFPTLTSVYRWRKDNPEFRDRFTEARYAQSAFFADELIRICRDDSKDYVEDGKGNLKPSTVNLQRQGLLCYNIRFLISRFSPEFKERTAHEVVTAEIQNNTVEVIAVDRPPKETHEEWLKRISSQRVVELKKDDVQ